MPLPLTAESLDAIPEGARGAYVEREGKFHLDAAVEDVTPLKAKNDELLTETKKERKQRQELERRLAEIEAEHEARAAGLTSEKLAEIQKKAEDRFKPQLDELAALRQENRTLKLDSYVKGLLAKAEAVDVDDAWTVTRDEYDLTDDGKPFLKADPTADLEKYITTALREKKPHLFKGTMAAGGGAGGPKGRPSTGLDLAKPSSWTSEQRAAYIEEHGAEQYRGLLNEQLRAAAAPKKPAA